MKMYLHINRFELKKGEKGYPWTIHTSKGCIRAKSVKLNAGGNAECFPKKKTNPKCFVIVHGEVRNLGQGKYELVPEARAARLKVASSSSTVLNPRNSTWKQLERLSKGSQKCTSQRTCP